MSSENWKIFREEESSFFLGRTDDFSSGEGFVDKSEAKGPLKRRREIYRKVAAQEKIIAGLFYE